VNATVIYPFPVWHFVFHFAFILGVSLLICRAFDYRFMIPIIIFTFLVALGLSLLWSHVGRWGRVAQEILWNPFETDYSLNPWWTIIPCIAYFWFAPMYLASLVIRYAKRPRRRSVASVTEQEQEFKRLLDEHRKTNC
jgi:hypothetical protein